MGKSCDPPLITGPNLGDSEKEYRVSTPPLHDAERGGFGFCSFV
jgi:hypothetical protein